jgi:hypothetical protein
MTKCAGYPHSCDRMVEILDIDFEEKSVFDVGVQSRNVATLFIVVEITGKIEFGKELQHAAPPGVRSAHWGRR